MKLSHTLITFLNIALGSLAQNTSFTLNQTLDTLNLTEAEALARSLTWYHLDEDNEQELCGNTDTHPGGKEDILKADCQELVNFRKVRPGYWKINGYNSHGIGFADLVTRGTCEFTVTREDALSTHFETSLKLTITAFKIGNLDVVDFVEAAMRVNSDPTRMPAVHGSVRCQGWSCGASIS